MTTARDVMNRGAQTVPPTATLVDAAKLMKNLGIGSLPVQDESGAIAGMVTDRDIVISAVADGADPSATSCGDIANSPVQTVDADTPISDVLSTMREHQVKRMPVTSDGELIGMISESDLVAELSGDQVAHFAEGVYKKD